MEHVATGPLFVGFGSADITPDDDQYLGGFDLNRRSTGVHSRLLARAIVFQVGERRVAVVGIDNLGLQREDVDWIKAGLDGLANGDVFLCSSHTHAAPDLIGLWGFYLLTSGRDLKYLANVRRGVVAAVQEAEKALRPATLWLGESRLPREGLVGNANRAGVFNRRITVLEASDRETGAPLGSLLHFACHPELLRRRNTLISSDFVGSLCERWEQAGHGPAVFVNGEIGALVSPSYRPSGAEGLPGLTSELLALCESALGTARRIEAETLEVTRSDVYLPLVTPGLVMGRLTGAIRRELYDGQLRSSVGHLKLGEFEAIAVPGEMEPVLASEIRRQAGRPGILVFGMVDDEVGYLMREQDARDPLFSYERTMSPGPSAGEIVRRALVGPVLNRWD